MMRGGIVLHNKMGRRVIQSDTYGNVAFTRGRYVFAIDEILR